MSEELKPCRCGGEIVATHIEAHDEWLTGGFIFRDGKTTIYCKACGGHWEFDNEDARLFVEQWNTRPTKPLTVDDIATMIISGLSTKGVFEVSKAIHAALPDQQELVEALKSIKRHIDNGLVLSAKEQILTALAKFGG